MDREKVSKSSSQIGFIKFVLLPLFETVGKLFPQLENAIIEPVRDALAYYTEMQRALEEEKARKDSLQETGDAAPAEKNGIISEKVTSGPNTNTNVAHGEGEGQDQNSPQHPPSSTSSPSRFSPSSGVVAPSTTDSTGKPRPLGTYGINTQGLMKAGSLRRSSTTQLSSTKHAHDVKASSPS
ncbi:high affinity cGMP-specific 3',5'-cyclic phosphodiesterase 9A-like [Elysia marginata]|uniref:High affinity cGMP-specific 3',5'-cyclic phosphodiesterase 9A-like n=1 Tax=Elysia marginata TaxID=1093978 RepID=A0AAV4J717_9GAST|nr:high affinity cGMP-specific 3',5'-cyclic phosphodiesterase 9A-like [Elysia marginata]